MFPKISRSIAAANLDEARHDLVSALNNVGLLIMFFAAAMVVFPEPIIRALLPSVSMDETMLISYALIALSMGIPLGSAVPARSSARSTPLRTAFTLPLRGDAVWITSIIHDHRHDGTSS